MITVLNQINTISLTNDAVVLSVASNPLILNISTQGAQGTPGTGFPGGGLEGQALVKKSDANFDTEWQTIGNIFIATAGQTISSLKVVYIDPLTSKIFYADKDIPLTINSLLGITTQSGILNDNISVTTAGQLQDSSWNWDMTGNVNLFLGSNGGIIQGFVSGATVAKIGYAISSTEIFIRMVDTILTN